MGTAVGLVTDVEFKSISNISDVIASSGLFGIKTKAQALALGLIAMAEGRNPVSAAMDYDIIQGRPALKASAMLARFQDAGGKIKWIKRSDTVCEAEFTHESAGSVTVKWDIERAKQAQLLGKDNWKKYPAQMLSARVISEGVNITYPKCKGSFYTVEEVGDFTKTDQQEKNSPTPTDFEVVPEAEKQLDNSIKIETKCQREQPAPEEQPPVGNDGFEVLLASLSSCQDLASLKEWHSANGETSKKLIPVQYDNLSMAFKRRWKELSDAANPGVSEAGRVARDTVASGATGNEKYAGTGLVKTITGIVKSVDVEKNMFFDDTEVGDFLKFMFNTPSTDKIKHEDAMGLYKRSAKNKDEIRMQYSKWRTAQADTQSEQSTANGN